MGQGEFVSIFKDRYPLRSLAYNLKCIQFWSIYFVVLGGVGMILQYFVAARPAH